MKTRTAIATALCVLLFLAGRFIWVSWRFHETEKNFDRVSEGMSISDVLKILGKPTYHEGDCLQDLKVSSNCAKEFVYGPFLAPLNPEYYVVDFSSDGHVISATHLMSP